MRGPLLGKKKRIEEEEGSRPGLGTLWEVLGGLKRWKSLVSIRERSYLGGGLLTHKYPVGGSKVG